MSLKDRIFAIMLAGIFFNVHAECSSILNKTTPVTQFQVLTNGVVLDRMHNLMWMRCSVGQVFDANTCTGSASKLKWLVALEQSEKMTIAGFSDWRLPNKNELNSIMELSCTMPAINVEIFPATSSASYWTSSPNTEIERYIWVIDFASGNIFIKDMNQLTAVRLVRDL